MICESYYEAIRSSTPSQIEAIDMGRRGLHNEGSQTLMDRLAGKIDDRFRHRAPPVHAGLRAALAGLIPVGEPARRYAEIGPVHVRHECGALADRRGAGAQRCCRTPSSPPPACAPASATRSSTAVLGEEGLSLGDRRPHARRTGGRLFRPDRHAGAGSPPRRARSDALHGGRRRILADARSDRGDRHARADHAAYRDVRDRLKARISRRVSRG
jgi:hypothetical protein